MTVTIRDVAKTAGVSITTVSRALNGYDDVSLATKKKILQIAQDLNYRPSQVARSLVMNRTHTIGLLVSDFNKDRGGNHFMFDVLAGLQEKLDFEGFDITLVSTTSAEQRLTTYLNLCTERRFEGVVVMGIRLDDPYVREVVEAPLPSVVIDLPLLSGSCGYVMTDNVNGAKYAVHHLARKGHKKIGFVNGHKQAAVSIDRRRGYDEALQEVSIALDSSYVYDADFTLAGGTKGTEILLERHPDITAVFYASDLMAIGGLHYAEAHDMLIPQDLAIVGFDNIDLSEFIRPSLTTVSQPRFQMGSSAADMLVRMLQNQQLPEGRMLSPQLVQREST